MVTESKIALPEILKKHESAILADWLKEQASGTGRRSDLMNESDLRRESGEFLRAFREALQRGQMESIDGAEWKLVREILENLSSSRARAGFSPAETAMFVFSLKQPLFARLGQEFKNDATALAREIWASTLLIDRLGLFTTDSFQRTREEVIQRQQQEMLELSTPVVKLWDGILALPMIGTLDSARTQVVMETLLQKIVDTGSEVAIIDITGVPQVDTLVAQHLLKTVTAARLMGAECIISGIRPQIAQTIVHLGVDLGNITTKASLADAFLIALSRTGRGVRTVAAAGGSHGTTQHLGGQAAAGLTTRGHSGSASLAARA